MKTEPCEPCEWAGIDTEAQHYVGWDHMPLCDMHFELDKLGRLGNWVNDNVEFDPPGDTPTEPREVESGSIKLKPARQPLTADEIFDTLESDAWLFLKGAGAGELRSIYTVSYIIDFLRGHRDVSDLEITLEQVIE